MHHLIKPVASAVTAALTVTGVAVAAPLTVVVDGVEARGGTFYVSVQTEAEYMQPTGTEGSMDEAPDAGTVTKTFDVPPGDYAVTVWHDDDGNGQFDTGPGGMPADGWALSGTMSGPPTFDDAKVTIGEDGAEVRVTMTYGR